MGWLDAAVKMGTDALSKNAGGIAAGVAGAVLGSGTSKGGGNATTSITSVPTWMSDYAQQLLGQANVLASQPYQQYSGPRIAGFTQDQNDAANLIRTNTGQASGVIQDAMGQLDPNAGQGMLTQAGQYLDKAGGSWLDNSDRYMADYTSKVIDPSKAQAMRLWDEQLNPGISAKFAGQGGVGAYGSPGMLASMQQAGVKLGTQLGENMAAYQDKGYSQGANIFGNEQSRQGQLAQIAAGLGKQTQDMNLAGVNTQADLAKQWAAMNAGDVSALQGIGAQEQAQNQGAMDVDYQNWLEQQDYGKGQLSYLQDFLKNSDMGNRTTSGTNASTTYTSPLQAATGSYALYQAIMNGTKPPGTAGGSGALTAGQQANLDRMAAGQVIQ
jgi:hypothetical protein